MCIDRSKYVYDVFGAMKIAVLFFFLQSQTTNLPVIVCSKEARIFISVSEYDYCISC